MKTLYLMRHAKSSWGNAHLGDFERPLNERGESDAPEMGRRLSQKSPRPQLIYASPAERTRQTILYVADALGHPTEEIQWREKIYGAGVEDILSILEGTSDSIETTLLIGHNPTMGFCVAHWSRKFDHHFPTAALACLQIETDRWMDLGSSPGILVDYDYPKLDHD
jgi:phosphohistidine phosphatase